MADSSGATATKAEQLPYSLRNLQWDVQHHFNVQNKYSYTGKSRKLGDPMLHCDMCEQWFHLKDVSCVPADANFVPFQRNYRFCCRICVQGPEQFEVQINTWTSVVLTATYNLLLTDDRSALHAGKWVKTREVVEWIEQNWGTLCAGRDMSQLLENNAVQKCIAYPQNATLFTASPDRSEVLLKHVAPSKLLLRPLDSSTISGSGVPGVVKPKKTDSKANSKKRGASGKAGNKDAKQPRESILEPAPTLEQIKLPEKYRLVPVPKNVVASHQDPSVVQLSRSARAPQIALKEDGRGVALTAVGFKGFRMVRATHGVANGQWYYEVKIKESGQETDFERASQADPFPSHPAHACPQPETRSPSGCVPHSSW